MTPFAESPREGFTAGASVPCDVTPGLAFPKPIARRLFPSQLPWSPNQTNLPQWLASIQYKNGPLRQGIVASPLLCYGIERQNAHATMAL